MNYEGGAIDPDLLSSGLSLDTGCHDSSFRIVTNLEKQLVPSGDHAGL